MYIYRYHTGMAAILQIFMMMSSMEILSMILALSGNSLVTDEFLQQKPVTRSFDIFFDLRLNKRLSKQSRRRWFETPCSVWRLYSALVENICVLVLISLKFVPWGLIYNESLVHVMARVLVWRKGHTWTKDEPVQWRVYASVGFNALTPTQW